jgi:2-(1,2-epoxy-1,2-dihydrophenyl)acetyl-CoA isomerase
VAEEEILLERRGAVAVVTLNRPEKLNAFHRRSNALLMRYLQELGQDEEVRAVVLTGAGRGFCSGADLTRDTDPTVPPYVWTPPQGYDLVPPAIQQCPKVVIGAINGVTAGAGVAFALACDLRIASTAASFAPLQLQRAINADYGLSYLLGRTVGTQRALEILTRGEPVGAEEALALGLVLELTPPERLMERALEWAERMARQPTVALSITKHSLHFGMSNSLAETARLESWGNGRITQTADFQEAMAAFRERRKPEFTGR